MPLALRPDEEPPRDESSARPSSLWLWVSVMSEASESVSTSSFGNCAGSTAAVRRGHTVGPALAAPTASTDHNTRAGMHRREGTSEAASEAVRQAVGGGCQSGWGRLLSVTNAIETGTCRQGDGGWVLAGRSERRGGLPPFQCIPRRGVAINAQ